MGNPKGFLTYKREVAKSRSVCERIKDYREIVKPRANSISREQASRCMDCGIPFCHWGCPLNSYIPEWNDLMFNDQWERAFELLDATNILPEVTGRVCPAICEYACILGINDEPVTIRENELAIIEDAFRKGYIRPRPPKNRSNKKVAIIGSGPSGLSTAVFLNRIGHNVVVFEQDNKIGGIMRYGIPDFKLEKWILDRRIEIWKKEGIRFMSGVCVGKDISVLELTKQFDAVCLAGGSRIPRDLVLPGRQLSGIHFAMDYLLESNRRVAKEKVAKDRMINVKGKRVVVIGGGDTGADCVGVAKRQGATSVTQIELLPKPANKRDETCPWPQYPMLLKTGGSYEEGVTRQWSVLTKEFIGDRGQVTDISCVSVKFDRKKMKEIPKSLFQIRADLVILALGFLHPQHQGLLEEVGVEYDVRGNVETNDYYMTQVKGIFCAGDMRRGQSLIVWALYEGCEAAYQINQYLEKKGGNHG